MKLLVQILLFSICLNASANDLKVEELFQLDGNIWAISKYDNHNLVVLSSNQLLMLNIQNKQVTVLAEFGDKLSSYKSHNEIIVEDILPEVPGKEIVFKGSEHYIPSEFTSIIPKVHLVYKSGATWKRDEVGYCDWTITTGQVIEQSQSKEILCGEEGDVLDFGRLRIYEKSDDGWSDQVVFNAEVPMQIAMADFDSTKPGEEILFVTEMGPTYLLSVDNVTAGIVSVSSSLVWNNFENAGWTLKSNKHSSEVFYGSRYSNSILFGPTAQEEPAVVFKGAIENGSLDPNIISLDYTTDLDGINFYVLASDFTGSIHELRYINTEWKSLTKKISESPILSIVIDGEMAFFAAQNGTIYFTKLTRN